MKERINELIEECTSVNDDLVYDGSESYMQTTEYFDKEKFAALVEAAARADEREACAKLCDEVGKESLSHWPYRFANMIRARGTT